MPFVIVEQVFESPTDAASLRAVCANLERCLAVREVTFVSSWLAQAGKRALFVYEAPDAEAVRNAHRSAGVPFERVWSADAFSPEAPTDPSP
jgi:hypothetical protein